MAVPKRASSLVPSADGNAEHVKRRLLQALAGEESERVEQGEPTDDGGRETG